MRVELDIDHYEVESSNVRSIEGLLVRCPRCGHEVEVAGTSEASAKAGACMLREECLNSENNFYDTKGWDG
jgi:ribosomal protein S27AE